MRCIAEYKASTLHNSHTFQSIMMDSAVSWLIILVLVSGTMVQVKSHPQCLDFKAPFEAEGGLNFCSEYSEFGCCTGEEDRIKRQRYNNIINNFLGGNTLTLDEGCRLLLKQVLCQDCSPYAAHIFDAESSRMKIPFPGLCRNYCGEFYDKCQPLITEISNDDRVRQALGSRDQFCDSIQLSDPDYCYPDWTNSPKFQQDISRETLTEEGCLCLEPFADNLRNALSFRFPDDGSGRIFISEQLGMVHIFYKNKTRITEPFMDLSHMVLSSSSPGDERGFLNLAFHPEFKDNQKLYVYFSVTSNSGSQTIRISEFLVSSEDPNRVDHNNERVILEVDQPYSNHNGGELLFGTDNYLYAFLGDGGGGGDPLGSGQDKSTLLGSVLRLDIDTGDPDIPYLIPETNPFVNEVDSRPEIYAYGIRNIWRCDVDEGDPDTGYGRGRIFCGDVGQGTYEEIDIIEKGGNYGWNSREGFECYRQSTCGNIGPEVLPIHAYDHQVGKSVTGGHVYRGCANPNLQGLYIFGDYVDGKVFRLKEDMDANTWEGKEVLMCGDDVCFGDLTNQYPRNILSFGADDQGEIYILTTSYASSTSASGRVYKIVDPRRRGDPNCGSAPMTTEPTTEPTTTTTTTTQPTTTTTEADQDPVSRGQHHLALAGSAWYVLWACVVLVLGAKDHYVNILLHTT